MVGRALDVGVFLSDDLYMSSEGVMSVSKEGKEDDERSTMSQISLLIHSVIRSICTSSSHSTSDKSKNITFTELEALVIHLPI